MARYVVIVGCTLGIVGGLVERNVTTIGYAVIALVANLELLWEGK